MHDNRHEDKLRHLVISAFKEAEEKKIAPSYLSTIYSARKRLEAKKEQKSTFKPALAIALSAIGLLAFFFIFWSFNPVNRTQPPGTQGQAVTIDASYWNFPSDALLRIPETSFSSDFMLMNIDADQYKKLPNFTSNYSYERR